MRRSHRSALATLVATALAACAHRAGPAPARPSVDTPRIEVVVDRRIELLGIVFRLAGAEEFGMDQLPQYQADVDRFFAPQRDHPIVAAVRKLRETRGVSNDAVMSYAIHLTDVPQLAARMPFERSQLETRWRPEDARAFLPLVQDFARVSHAERFFADHQALYDTTVARMRALIAAEVDQAWLTRFFGSPPARSRFILAIAPNNGTWAYGTRYWAPDGAQELYAIMNVSQHDSAGVPTFTRANVATIVHEFSHSFVNPVVEAHLPTLAVAADTVLAAVAAPMRRQGYTSGRTLVSESLVRAAVARYVLAHGGADSARRELDEQQLNGFVWIDDYRLLGVYEASRDRYPTLDAYAPTIAAYYADLAPRIRTVVADFERALDARRPRVVSMTPTNGATDVDPATSSLVFRFDRPMRSSYATMLVGPNGRERFPETTRSAWDSTRTAFTMTVRLRPGRAYEFALNAASVTGFRSADGVPLAPYRVTFTTRPAR